MGRCFVDDLESDRDLSAVPKRERNFRAVFGGLLTGPRSAWVDLPDSSERCGGCSFEFLAFGGHPSFLNGDSCDVDGETPAVGYATTPKGIIVSEPLVTRLDQAISGAFREAEKIWKMAKKVEMKADATTTCRLGLWPGLIVAQISRGHFFPCGR